MQRLIIYPEYFYHPNVLSLEIEMGYMADIIPIRLWLWAIAFGYHNKSISHINPRYIEEAVRWEGDPNRCYKALIGNGFISKENDYSLGFRDELWDIDLMDDL